MSLDRLAIQPGEVRDHWIREVLDSVVLAPETPVVRLDAAKITGCRETEWDNPSASESSRAPTCPYTREVETRGRHIVLTLSIRIKRLDGRRLILSPDGRDLVLPAEPEPREHMVNVIGLAYQWHEELLSSGRKLTQVARDHCVSERWIRRLLPVTQPSPRCLKHAPTGSLPPSLTLNDLLAAAEHLDWSQQIRALGLRVSTEPRKLG